MQDGRLVEEFTTSVQEVLCEPLSVGICSEMKWGNCGVNPSGYIDFSAAQLRTWLPAYKSPVFHTLEYKTTVLSDYCVTMSH